jgi:GNAT superfamily N-acetyltransferase
VANDYPLVVSGVPENWHDNFKMNGFSEYAVFQDYWIDLLAPPGVQYSDYVYLHNDECTVASEITFACYGQSRGFEGESAEWFFEWLRGNEELQNSVIIASKVNGKIVGISCAVTYAHDSEKGAVVWVRMMAVHPSFQRQGIGTKRLMQTLQYGFEHGAIRAFLHADTLNANAIKMYLKAGFQPRINEKQVDMIRREK